MARYWLTPLLTLGIACGASQTTDRIYDGRWTTGAAVDEAAYAYYLDGAQRFQRGDVDGAAQAFRRALAISGESAELHSRLGQALCRKDAPGALDEFQKAHAIDSTYGFAWLAKSQCLLSRGRTEEALRASEMARGLLPNSSDAELHHARLLQARGQSKRAIWLLFTASLRAPSRELLDELSRQATGIDAPLAQWARHRSVELTTLVTRAGCDLPNCPQELSHESRPTRSDEMEGLLQNGRLPEAAQLARLWLRAEPTSMEARVFALWLAHLQGDERRFDELLRNLGRESSAPLSTPARERLLQLVEVIQSEPVQASTAAQPRVTL